MDRKELRERAPSMGSIASEADMTAAEILHAEGEALGVVTGRAEGRAEGEMTERDLRGGRPLAIDS